MRLLRGATLVGVPGEAEVGQVDAALPREEHVAGLHVPMHQPQSVTRVERIGHRADDRDRTPWLEPPLLGEQRPQVGALDVAHGQVEEPVRLAGVVDVDDVRVVEAGRQLRLAQEPLPETLVPGQLGRQQLQRHPALQPQLLGQVHDPHPPTADHRLDPVAGHVGTRAEIGAREADLEREDDRLVERHRAAMRPRIVESRSQPLALGPDVTLEYQPLHRVPLCAHPFVHGFCGPGEPCRRESLARCGRAGGSGDQRLHREPRVAPLPDEAEVFRQHGSGAREVLLEHAEDAQATKRKSDREPVPRLPSEREPFLLRPSGHARSRLQASPASRSRSAPWPRTHGRRARVLSPAHSSKNSMRAIVLAGLGLRPTEIDPNLAPVATAPAVAAGAERSHRRAWSRHRGRRSAAPPRAAGRGPARGARRLRPYSEESSGLLEQRPRPLELAVAEHHMAEHAQRRCPNCRRHIAIEGKRRLEPAPALAQPARLVERRSRRPPRVAPPAPPRRWRAPRLEAARRLSSSSSSRSSHRVSRGPEEDGLGLLGQSQEVAKMAAAVRVLLTTRSCSCSRAYSRTVSSSR